MSRQLRLVFDWVVLRCVDLVLGLADLLPARLLRLGEGAEPSMKSHP